MGAGPCWPRPPNTVGACACREAASTSVRTSGKACITQLGRSCGSGRRSWRAMRATVSAAASLSPKLSKATSVGASMSDPNSLLIEGPGGPEEPACVVVVVVVVVDGAMTTAWPMGCVPSLLLCSAVVVALGSGWCDSGGGDDGGCDGDGDGDVGGEDGGGGGTRLARPVTMADRCAGVMSDTSVMGGTLGSPCPVAAAAPSRCCAHLARSVEGGGSAEPAGTS